MTEGLTIGDDAKQEAAGRRSFGERLVYTDRIFVKKSHENADMLGAMDQDEAAQYYARELRLWARPLLKMMVSGLDRGNPDRTFAQRILAINALAKDQPDAISTYNRDGKVESAVS